MGQVRQRVRSGEIAVGVEKEEGRGRKKRRNKRK